MIAVLLNDPWRWSDATALLQYGFGAAGSAARLRDGDRHSPLARATVNPS